MQEMTWIELIDRSLEILGAYVVIMEIVLPTLDLFFYACGYVLLNMLNVDYRKAGHNPMGFLRFLYSRFKQGLAESVSFFRSERITLGEWVWVPLFRFRRKGTEVQSKTRINKSFRYFVEVSVVEMRKEEA
jgi:hypothetical protein